METALHSSTPNLSCVDPRHLQVREIAYYRSAAQSPIETRPQRGSYDARGRLISRWDPRFWALIEAGHAAPANQRMVHALSGAALATVSVDAGWQVLLLDEAGQTLRSWDSRGNQSRLEHDALLRPIAVFEQPANEPERCVERLRYGSTDSAANNLYGQLIEHDDTAGRRQICQLAVTGGVLEHSRRFLANEQTPDWPVTAHEGEALLETGSVAISRARFNALGEAVAEIDAMGHRRRYMHSVAGQPKGAFLQLAGQLEQSLLLSIHFNAFGQVEEETAGNGVQTQASYSPVDGRLDRLRAAKTGASALQDLTYTYDPVGNILSIRDDAQPVRHFNNQRIEPINTYRYDTLYQLIEATGRESASPSHGPALPGMMPTPVDPNQLANYTQTFTYDAGGNLTTLRHVGARSFTREMDVAALSNRSVIKGELDLDTAFDGDGNLLQLQPGQRLEWDARNQLRQVTPVERAGADDDYECYIYDAGGQRVRKLRCTQAHGVTHRAQVRYLPGLELRSDTATDETLQTITVSAGRNQVRVLHWEAGKPDGLDNGQVRYGLSDHLSSTALELDDEGSVISQEGYYPYGGTAWWAGRNATQAKYNVIRYSGKERDATGLYYYGFRYYAPWLNRWINPDPAGVSDGLNLFEFVANNPVRFIDTDGLARLDYLDLADRQQPAHKVIAATFRRYPSVLRRYEDFSRATLKAFYDTEGASNNVKERLSQRGPYGFTQKQLDWMQKMHPNAHLVAHAGVTSSSGERLVHNYFNLQGRPGSFPGTRPRMEWAYEPARHYRAGTWARHFLKSSSPPATYEITDIDSYMKGVHSRYKHLGTALHPYVERLIRQHAADNNYRLPSFAGIAGLHAEVQAFNGALWQSGVQAGFSQFVSNTFVFTQRMKTLDRKTRHPRDFPACYNCSGILPPLLNVITGRRQNAAPTGMSRRHSVA